MAGSVAAFVEKLGAAGDVGAIHTLVETELQSRGFDRFAYLILQPPEGPHEPVYIGSYPADWTEHYIARDYVNVDPVMATATETIAPFAWKDLYKLQPSDSRQRLMLDEAGDFGLRNGMTIPVHGPARAFATFNIAASVSPAESEELWNTHKFDIHIIALHSHEEIIKAAYAEARRKPVHLAPRERECLLWTSRGKTAWEISMILGLSQDTVLHYLRTANGKLGVCNKTHAVVKAIITGLIVP
ncbi:MAG: LuxR family transcriptional regulator [Alphaproteobacteria bacterium]|nr:LuxR family transcriptional regulator [Alphaproteobacteria bacterium]